MLAGPTYESLEQQHSWCKYHRDRINNLKEYEPKKCLPNVFRGELKPLFERLSSNDLLLGCQKGLTQNQNESLNGVVWSRIPKRLFCGKRRFTISLCDAVSQFNDGAKGRKNLLKTLNLKVTFNTMTGLKRQDTIRLTKVSQKITTKYKNRRQALRSIRKNKNKRKDKSYISGAFSKKTVPDVDFVNYVPDIQITFVNDNDVNEIRLVSCPQHNW